MAGNMQRHIKDNQNKIPTNLSSWQQRPKSKYSYPWWPTQKLDSAGILSRIAHQSPKNAPAVTSTKAIKSTSAPSFWYLGSLPPLIMGAKNKPAAKKATAIQNIAACKCHERTKE